MFRRDVNLHKNYSFCLIYVTRCLPSFTIYTATYDSYATLVRGRAESTTGAPGAWHSGFYISLSMCFFFSQFSTWYRESMA